jgi:hypothetical protein
VAAVTTDAASATADSPARRRNASAGEPVSRA